MLTLNNLSGFGVGGDVICLADFDGTNDYMLRGAALTGVADGTKGIFSAWLRVDGGAGGIRTILEDAVTSALVRFRISGANVFSVALATSGGVTRVAMTSANTIPVSTSLVHVMASWDVSVAGARHIYVNGASDISVTTFSNGTISYASATDWAIGGTTAGGNLFDGCIGHLYFNSAEYLDLSLESNRVKFRTNDGQPADLGTDGSRPTGTAPIVYQRLIPGDAATVFATNKGTGGDFTITGSLDAVTLAT